MEIGNNRLDEHIKRSLDNLEPAFNEAHWKQFEDILDAEESAEVDGIVAASLGNFEVESAMPDWDLMEQKLEAEELTETAEVDNLAQKLNSYEAKYNNSHWELMARRLEEEYSLRRKLYKYKVFELALMLLLLITFINYMPFGGNKIEDFKEWKKFHFDNKKAETPAKQPVVSATPPIAAVSGNENESGVYENGIESKEIEFLTNNENNNQQKLTAYSRRVLQTKPETLPQRFSFVEIDDSNKPKVGLAFGNFNVQEGDIVANKNLAKTSLLAALDIPKTNVLSNVVDFPAMVFEPNKPNGVWKMSFFINSDVNYILSDDVEALSTKKDTTLGFGYGGGLMIGYKKGRFGLEFGGQYSYKKYPPNIGERITNKTGNPNQLLVENLQDIQLDILQIPLNFQYYAVDKSKWKFYTTTGVSLHLIALPVYQVESEIQYLNGGPPAPAPPGGEPVNNRAFKQTAEFPEGIFAGGSFSQNSYLTANLGFGVEGSFSPRWSIFAQPTYQHYFSKKGIKPFQDKFYTLSFSIGTRVNLK